MKSFSIVAIALCALVALSSALPVANEYELTAEARFDFYKDFLQGLFSGLVQTTLGSAAGALNQLITTNPLGAGKRNAEDDLQARIEILDFIYDNILSDLFTGLVSNTFGSLTSLLNNLITTNPLGIGKRNIDDDLQARIDLSIFDFIYDNILSDLFSGIVTNTFGTLSNTLTGLITTNPLGIGKRAAGVNIWSFLYDNIAANLFTGLVSNAANLAQSTLLNLINSNPLGVGKRAADFQQIETIVKQSIATIIQHFSTFAQQAVKIWTDKQQLATLVKGAITDFKAIIATLAEELSTVIPSKIAEQVDHVLGSLQSMLIFWTSGLGGSLGPVIGPFPH